MVINHEANIRQMVGNIHMSIKSGNSESEEIARIALEHYVMLNPEVLNFLFVIWKEKVAENDYISDLYEQLFFEHSERLNGSNREIRKATL